MRNIVIVATLAVVCTACATVPNPMAQQDRDALVVKAAEVNWEVDESKLVPTQSYQFDKQNIEGLIHNDVLGRFADGPHGQTPVEFKIHITGYRRVSAVVGNVLGGVNMVIADVDVVRESDGKVLGVYNAVYGMYANNHGVIGAIAQGMMKPDITGIMAETFAQNLRQRYDAATAYAFTAKPTRHLDVSGGPTPVAAPAPPPG